ncbi:MAG: cytochrome c3 family protein, partial [Deferrisomatales bacterium]|nr:cytochrome c3 family protein [Deferrisomatales bacterium]
LGSHTVMTALGSTNSGGGWTGAAAGVRTGGQYMKITAWSTLAQSKYGDPAGYTKDGPAADRATDWDMLCESCHNVLVNAGDQLLVEAYTNASVDTLCVGCHGGTVGETYAGFHGNGNLKAFGTSISQATYTGLAGRKRHHVLNAETLDTVAPSPYDPDSDVATSDSVMWAPSYSKELGTGLYATWTEDATSPIGEGAVFTFRNLVNVSGVGTLSTAAAAGDIPTGTELRCTSCHRPHNAITNAGAFILRSGNGAATFPSGVGVTGMERQVDNTSTAVYGEYTPICAGCHQGYGI